MCERTAVWRMLSGPALNSYFSSSAISYSLRLDVSRVLEVGDGGGGCEKGRGSYVRSALGLLRSSAIVCVYLRVEFAIVGFV